MEKLVTVDKADTLEVSEMTNRTSDGKRILFVCTGNTCRSPMAAAVYNDRFDGDGSRAFSAGLAADGSGISRNAVLALVGEGIKTGPGNDYLSHVSHTVTEVDIAAADLVVGITGRHAMQLLLAFPEAAGKITALPQDIADPYGGDEGRYRLCLSQICAVLSEIFVQNDGYFVGDSEHDKDGE